MSANPSEVVRAHVWVTGQVQGVGFRAHVEYSARQARAVTGWVRNVGYDTVEAVIEGPRANVERLIDSIKQGPRASHVTDTRVEWEPVTGEFTGFGIRRSL